VAKVSVYVSDELKARMDASGELTNWSEVARPAFLSAVTSNEYRKEQNMTTAIERLRASKAEYLSELKTEAAKAGREWASGLATYRDLARLAKLEPEIIGYDSVNRIIDPEKKMSREDFARYLGVNEDDLDDEDFLADFVEAAQAFYDEVSGQL
jgi:hypothetical protein